MAAKGDQLSEKACMQVNHSPIFAIVLVDYTASKQPVPYFLCFIHTVGEVPRLPSKLICHTIQIPRLIYNYIIEFCQELGPSCVDSIQEVFSNTIFAILTVCYQLYGICRAFTFRSPFLEYLNNRH
jgi:hypothetical protein